MTISNLAWMSLISSDVQWKCSWPNKPVYRSDMGKRKSHCSIETWCLYAFIHYALGIHPPMRVRQIQQFRIWDEQATHVQRWPQGAKTIALWSDIQITHSVDTSYTLSGGEASCISSIPWPLIEPYLTPTFKNLRLARIFAVPENVLASSFFWG